MDDTKTGGPAFPTLLKAGDLAVSEGGMTLRDHFAGKAMEGMAIRYDLLSHTANDGPHTPDVVAKFCYQMADAMLRVRDAA